MGASRWTVKDAIDYADYVDDSDATGSTDQFKRILLEAEVQREQGRGYQATYPFLVVETIGSRFLLSMDESGALEAYLVPDIRFSVIFHAKLNHQNFFMVQFSMEDDGEPGFRYHYKHSRMPLHLIE